MFKHWATGLALLMACAMGGPELVAQTSPAPFRIQARLYKTNNAGTKFVPFRARKGKNYTVTVRLYSGPSGAAILNEADQPWEETISVFGAVGLDSNAPSSDPAGGAVAEPGGGYKVLNLLIGASTDLPSRLFEQDVWFTTQVALLKKGIQTKTFFESPRQPLGISGYTTGQAIDPLEIRVAGQLVVDETGQWVGASSGLTGPAGPAGPVGADGADGAPGLTGARGPTGPTGSQGAQGMPGVDGAQGPTGSQGAQGMPGVDGAQGPTGPTGAQGLQGVDGTQGLTGPTGPSGAQGMSGVDGARGPTGPTGAPGLPGTDGAPGVAGATGATGATGTPGPTGPTGTSSWTDGTGMVTTTASVGIGVVSPGAALEVAGDILTAGDLRIGSTGIVKSTPGGNLDSSLDLRSEFDVQFYRDESNQFTNSWFQWFDDGAAGNFEDIMRLDGELGPPSTRADLKVKGSVVPNGLDLAEYYPASDPTLRAGMVVALDMHGPLQVVKAERGAATNVLGIISTEPGVTLGGDMMGLQPELLRESNRAFHQGDSLRGRMLRDEWSAIEAARTDRVPVALAGRVPVFVDGSGGLVAVGDRLGLGALPGYAARYRGTGPVVGIALESWNGVGDTLLAFVHLEASPVPERPVVETPSMGGAGTIPRGQDRVVVRHPALQPQSKLVITFLADPEGSYWVNGRDVGTFVLRVSNPSAVDRPFSFVLVP